MLCTRSCSAPSTSFIFILSPIWFWLLMRFVLHGAVWYCADAIWVAVLLIHQCILRRGSSNDLLICWYWIWCLVWLFKLLIMLLFFINVILWCWIMKVLSLLDVELRVWRNLVPELYLSIRHQAFKDLQIPALLGSNVEIGCKGRWYRTGE